MLSLGAGLYWLAFAHMVTHAFFKALLFIRVGNMLHENSRYQDIRTLNLGAKSLPSSVTARLLANFSLMGLPFLSGFVSKDTLLEAVAAQRVGALSGLLLYSGVILTMGYSLRLILAVLFVEKARSSVSTGTVERGSTPRSLILLRVLTRVGGAGLFLTTRLLPPLVPALVKPLPILLFGVRLV